MTLMSEKLWLRVIDRLEFADESNAAMSAKEQSHPAICM